MSRCYEMTMSVRGYNDDHLEAIIDAVSDLGYEAEGDSQGEMFQFYSETINIAAGYSDESVAREVVEAIWQVNGGFCKVHVGMRDLDADFPAYSWDEAAFDKWRQGKDGE